MNQLFSQISNHTQTALAAIVIIMVINLGVAVGGVANAGTSLPAAMTKDQTGRIIPVKTTSVPVPVLVLADPGRAFVLSAPYRQMQVDVEGTSGLCKTALVQTDSSGIYEMSVAATRRCADVRLVVLY